MRFHAVIIGATLVSGLATAAMASSEQVIYNFSSKFLPEGRLDQGNDGSFVGNAYYGPGATGSVFRLTEKRGIWSEDVIHKFTRPYGANPESGVVQDNNDVYYGTTDAGGNGYGTVYSLARVGGKWVETVLYAFDGGSDGSTPKASLLYDTVSGDLYGTTYQGGRNNCGTAFQLAQSGGAWHLTTIWTFEGMQSSDGCNPRRGLHTGATDGTLIGTTESGGTGSGTVFELKQTGGNWTEKVLTKFGGEKGENPQDIDIDPTTNIAYGVTYSGGSRGYGVMFSVNLGGHPKETVVYNFLGGSNGANPVGMRYDKVDDILYGTTEYGGTYGLGTAFKFVPNGQSWTETILHSFGGGEDGAYPQSRPILDLTTGALYGTTTAEGQFGGGTVWAITP